MGAPSPRSFGSPLVPPERLARAVVPATVVVAGLGLIAELAYAYGPAGAASWTGVLSLSFEGNVPTWYISGLLLSCALSLGAAGIEARRAEDRSWRGWWALGGLFALMSLDETAQLHEHLYVLVDGSGLLYFSWVIPGAAIAAAVALGFARFWWRLRAATRRRFALAGALYLAGALAMELPLGYWTERAGDDNLTYGLIDFVEESLELAGATTFLLAIARHRADPEGAGAR